MTPAQANDTWVTLELDLLLGGLSGRLGTLPPHVLLEILYQEAGPIIEKAGANAEYVARRVKLMAVDAGLLPRPDTEARL